MIRPGDIRTLRRACWLVPLLLGLWSALLGVDANWDLYNYHLYNPYAFLDGRLARDLAPAGLQTYFSPLLDLSFYLPSRYLPTIVVAFAMGCLHGLVFLPLVSIARQVLADLPECARNRAALLLAIAGVLTGNFLSELGNSMGDNLTALLVLSGVALLMRASQGARAGMRNAFTPLALGAVVVGAAAGLKLTNAPYAVAFCASLLFFPLPALHRLGAALAAAGAAALGMLLTGGYWHHEMWTAFGNPFFPQFSAYFPNELARGVGVVDTQWRPKDFLEGLLWPFLFSLDSHRVGQARIRQVVWPIVYMAFFAWMAVRAANGARGSAAAALDGRRRLLVAFVAISYVVWMAMFSIYRYLVPAELLAPLTAFVLLAAFLPLRKAAWIAGACLGASAAMLLAGGFDTWGHHGHAWKAYEVDLPPAAETESGAVVIVGGDPPWAWLAPFFPRSARFVQVGGNFPEGAGYRPRVDELVSAARGRAHAVFAGSRDARRESMARIDRHARGLGLTTSESGCAFARWAVATLHLRARVGPASQGRLCELLPRESDVKDVRAEDERERAKAQATLRRYGYAIERGACRSYRARVGDDISVYQWCPIGPARERSGRPRARLTRSRTGSRQLARASKQPRSA